MIYQSRFIGKLDDQWVDVDVIASTVLMSENLAASGWARHALSGQRRTYSRGIIPVYAEFEITMNEVYTQKRQFLSRCFE